MKPIRLFCADLDGTVAGTRIGEAMFFEALMSISESERPILVYNSGRLIDDMRHFLPETNLPPADVLIGGVGTMLLRFSCLADGQIYADRFDGEFDAEKVEKLVRGAVSRLELQPKRHQTKHKSSWYLQDADPHELRQIDAVLSDAGLRVRLVYSSNRNLDILPEGADKGSALAWLCDRLGIATEEVLVAGDTENDRSMFDLADARGMIVANARDELKRIKYEKSCVYLAREQEGCGVVEGLVHFGLLPSWAFDAQPIG